MVVRKNKGRGDIRQEACLIRRSVRIKGKISFNIYLI